MKILFVKILLPFIAFAFLFATTAFGQSNYPLALGNPSAAKIGAKSADNFLVAHSGYTLSYNKSRGTANWVAWHLTKSDVGSVERSNDFAPDTLLPNDWWVKPSDYTGSGYDRGHMCPSKDRSSSDAANRETFLMSNMQPQTPKLNQKTWKYLEDYERESTKQGNEAYIYSGCYGDNGKIANKVTIPTNCWKIIVSLPEGENDLKRIDKTTRVIAVNMPNDETVSQRWRSYLTTIDDIEAKTGYDFLSELPKKIQKIIESVKDTSEDVNEGTRPTVGTMTPDVKPAEDKQEDKKPGKKANKSDREYLIGARGGCYYLTESGKKSYVDKKFCENAAPAAPAVKTNVEPQPPPVVSPAPTEAAKETPTPAKSNSDGRTYVTGPKGGCYYINGSGKKVYVGKDKCGN